MDISEDRLMRIEKKLDGLMIAVTKLETIRETKSHLNEKIFHYLTLFNAVILTVISLRILN